MFTIQCMTSCMLHCNLVFSSSRIIVTRSNHTAFGSDGRAVVARHLCADWSGYHCTVDSENRETFFHRGNIALCQWYRATNFLSLSCARLFGNIVALILALASGLLYNFLLPPPSNFAWLCSCRFLLV